MKKIFIWLIFFLSLTSSGLSVQAATNSEKDVRLIFREYLTTTDTDGQEKTNMRFSKPVSCHYGDPFPVPQIEGYDLLDHFPPFLLPGTSGRLDAHYRGHSATVTAHFNNDEIADIATPQVLTLGTIDGQYKIMAPEVTGYQLDDFKHLTGVIDNANLILNINYHKDKITDGDSEPITPPVEPEKPVEPITPEIPERPIDPELPQLPELPLPEQPVEPKRLLITIKYLSTTGKLLKQEQQLVTKIEMKQLQQNMVTSFEGYLFNHSKYQPLTSTLQVFYQPQQMAVVVTGRYKDKELFYQTVKGNFDDLITISAKKINGYFCKQPQQQIQLNSLKSKPVEFEYTKIKSKNTLKQAANKNIKPHQINLRTDKLAKARKERTLKKDEQLKKNISNKGHQQKLPQTNERVVPGWIKLIFIGLLILGGVRHKFS
ncbi:MucBP domain-containing protein [Lentilactobacillus kribbianus]|uniref:MucBP domain-containing protein n=1 Tax=Lentilactobacillus kribbianus TaxID=2729622 RepID=UPI0015562492|nr:MucBP domain-containing protein [Lentilactobacillus kribbianus]